jgi:hypothetical protein
MGVPPPFMQGGRPGGRKSSPAYISGLQLTSYSAYEHASKHATFPPERYATNAWRHARRHASIPTTDGRRTTQHGWRATEHAIPVPSAKCRGFAARGYAIPTTRRHG